MLCVCIALDCNTLYFKSDTRRCSAVCLLAARTHTNVFHAFVAIIRFIMTRVWICVHSIFIHSGEVAESGFKVIPYRAS